MKRLLIMLCACIGVVEVQAQDYFLWKGRILEEDSRQPIEGGHIRSSNQQGLSDRDGFFTIPVKKGDRITISHVAYHSFEVSVKDNALPNIIFMLPKEQELDEVTVSFMPSEAQLKSQLLNTPYIPSQEEVHMRKNLSYMKTIYRMNNNHLLNAMDQVYQKINRGNGEVSLFSTNPSMGILGVIRSFRKQGAIPFDKQRDFLITPNFTLKSDSTIRFKKYFD